MKKFPKIILLTLVLALLFSLSFVSASAKSSTLFSENFAKMEDEYPASFVAFNPGSVQTVQKSAFVVSGGGDYGITDHGAVFAIDSATSRLTCSFKLKAGSNMIAAVAFAHNGKAVQASFAQGTILASFGGESDFMPVGSYGNDWVRVLFDIDFANNTYDIYVDDTLSAQGLGLSDQPLPVNLLFGAMGTDGTVSIDSILVKAKK